MGWRLASRNAIAMMMLLDTKIFNLTLNEKYPRRVDAAAGRDRPSRLQTNAARIQNRARKGHRAREVIASFQAPVMAGLKAR